MYFFSIIATHILRSVKANQTVVKMSVKAVETKVKTNQTLIKAFHILIPLKAIHGS